MAVTLARFEMPVLGRDGVTYCAKACGRQREDGLWEGWIEFTIEGGDRTLRTTRETTQPNLHDIEYWATGLSHVYLEGALDRTLPHPPRKEPPPLPPPAFDGPAVEEKTQPAPISDARP
jgi:hypothetical protein